jgi:hypothetical protein
VNEARRGPFLFKCLDGFEVVNDVCDSAFVTWDSMANGTIDVR